MSAQPDGKGRAEPPAFEQSVPVAARATRRDYGGRMARLILTLLLAVMPITPTASPQPYENVGAAMADLPDTALWHFKVFVAAPDNFRRFAADLEAARDKLKPGEEKRFEVLFRLDPAGEPLRYLGLHPAGEPLLSPGVPSRVTVVAEIAVKGTSLVRLFPLLPMTRGAFEQMREQAKTGTPIRFLEYEDVVFAVNAQTRLAGFDISFDPDKPPATTAGQFKWVDLLDAKATAVADGRVILVSKSAESMYRVYSERTGRAEEFKKGQVLINSGNTVYLLSAFAGKRFVTAYRNIHNTSVSPGDAVKAGQALGMLRPEAGRANACIIPKPRNDPEIAVFRVNREDQYFLANMDKEPQGRLLFAR